MGFLTQNIRNLSAGITQRSLLFVAPEKATSHGFGDPAVYVQVDSKKSDTPFRSVSSNPNSFCVGLPGPRPCKVFFE